MSTQFALFKYKRFSAMFATQFLGAFNDNVFKQGLILVLTFMAAAKIGDACQFAQQSGGDAICIAVFCFPPWRVKLLINMKNLG